MTIQFLRNKVVEVEPIEGGNLSVSWRLTDDLMKLETRLVVRIPEMEIIETEANVGRFPPKSCLEVATLIKNIEGVSIGSGLRKIVYGVLGGENGCPHLVEAVLESSNAVILHFTRPGIQLLESLGSEKEIRDGFKMMLQSNPRLVRSCIAFQDDSPLMEGLDL